MNNICSIDGCLNPIAPKVGKLCGAHRMRLRRYGGSEIPQREPTKTFIRQLVGMLKRMERLQRPQPKHIAGIKCKVCNADVPYQFGAPRQYCNRECMKINMSIERAMRQSDMMLINLTTHSKIRKYSAQSDGTVPRQVFDRDGFKCQLCNMILDPSLRGTNNEHAPEIDHIIPFAKGGDHTIDNLQVLCRSCNIIKGQDI